MLELLGHCSNPDNVSRLSSILAGRGRDQPFDRTVQSPRRHGRLDPDQTHKLIEAYQSGVSINDLATQFGIHRSTVLNIIERAGLPRRQGIIDRNLDEVRQLYDQGWSTAKIGQHFGVTADTVDRALRKGGIPMRKPWERA